MYIVVRNLVTAFNVVRHRLVAVSVQMVMNTGEKLSAQIE